MPRLIHLLAHHPDFTASDRDQDDLVNFSVYFNYYFEAVVNADNLVLIYHYCQRIKQVADAIAHDEANADVGRRMTHLPFTDMLQNIYVLSDIAQVVLTTRAEQNGWPLLAYPKRVKLPTELYKAQLDQDTANAKQEASFLTMEQRDAIKHMTLKSIKQVRHAHTKAPEPKKRAAGGHLASSRKRSRASTPPPSERRSSGRQRKMVDYSALSDSENVSSENLTDESDG